MISWVFKMKRHDLFIHEKSMHAIFTIQKMQETNLLNGWPSHEMVVLLKPKSHQNSIFLINRFLSHKKEISWKWCWLSKQEKNQIEKRLMGIFHRFQCDIFHHKAHTSHLPQIVADTQNIHLELAWLLLIIRIRVVYKQVAAIFSVLPSHSLSIGNRHILEPSIVLKW